MTSKRKQDAKTRLLRAGAKIVIQKGFNDTGLQEILDAARVPKGSFYFYFKSKEDYGLHLIDFYADFFDRHARGHFKGEEGPYIPKIEAFLDWQGDYMEAVGYQGGCPFGNLGQEMGDRNENFRTRLLEIFDRQRRLLAGVLEKARVAGEIRPDIDCVQMAEHIICAWQGTLIQMKLSQNSYSRKVFKQNIFGGLLAPPPDFSIGADERRQHV